MHGMKIKKNANECLCSVRGTELVDKPKHLGALLPSQEGLCCSLFL